MVEDLTMLDERYVRIKREANSAAAMDYYKQYHTMPDGFKLEQGEHLRIA